MVIHSGTRVVYQSCCRSALLGMVNDNSTQTSARSPAADRRQDSIRSMRNSSRKALHASSCSNQALWSTETSLLVIKRASVKARRSRRQTRIASIKLRWRQEGRCHRNGCVESLLQGRRPASRQARQPHRTYFRPHHYLLLLRTYPV